MLPPIARSRSKSKVALIINLVPAYVVYELKGEIKKFELRRMAVETRREGRSETKVTRYPPGAVESVCKALVQEPACLVINTEPCEAVSSMGVRIVNRRPESRLPRVPDERQIAAQNPAQFRRAQIPAKIRARRRVRPRRVDALIIRAEARPKRVIVENAVSTIYIRPGIQRAQIAAIDV